MAGLLFVVCSAVDELYRIGKVYIQSDGSFERCWNYVLETRQENFIKRYLHYLDTSAVVTSEFDNGIVQQSSTSRNKIENSFWSGGTTPDNSMAYQEIYEYTPYDVVDYAIIKVSYSFFIYCS